MSIAVSLGVSRDEVLGGDLIQLGGSVEGDGVGWCSGDGGGTGEFRGLRGGGDGGNDCSGVSEAPRTVSARLLLRLWRAPARPCIFFPPRKSSCWIMLTFAIKI